VEETKKVEQILAAKVADVPKVVHPTDEAITSVVKEKLAKEKADEEAKEEAADKAKEAAAAAVEKNRAVKIAEEAAENFDHLKKEEAKEAAKKPEPIEKA